MPQIAYGVQTRECNSNQICAFPKDYLKYSVNNFGHNVTTTYNFGDFVDASSIHTKIISDTENGTTTIDSVLNLKNSTFTQEDGKHQRFFMMVPTPLSQKWTGQPKYFDEVKNYNGLDRTTLGYHVHTATTSSDVNLDKDTGIMLDFTAYSTANIFNKTITRGISFKLLDTNIIPTPNSPYAVVSSPIPIPGWIKNTAKWWSQGTLSDNEFIQGIQYLVSHGIVKIPETQQATTHASQIPQWVKSNAGWWADGQISDQEFVKGIQYLISSGIINA